MTDPHHRATDLLLDALDRDPAEREAFLDDACDEAPGLRAEVASLLAAHEAAEAEDALAGTAVAADPLAGRTLGAWRLAERIGEGGMGAVYRADRADGAFERAVAVKVFRPGVTGADLAGRLADERRILATLEHENIARLYDGGVSADGVPFLVMELVDGGPITEVATDRALSVEARIDLFLQVCEAVAFAHRNLVVHRDLKPSNVLVADGRQPVAKLLDFGIAKVLSESEEPALQTRFGALTPSYAAPEQILGGAITTATDVYALGLLLYELLAGCRAYDVTGRSAGEIERTIAATQPSPPSTQVRTPDLARRIRGDLDTIVLKALAKEPERRYPSAEALAADLRRHRAGLPVEARPATAGYRARRFVQRHRLGVAAAAAVLIAILGGAGAALWQGRIAAGERDRAEAALVQAEGALGFLEDTILAGDPQEGDYDAPLSTVLDSAAARADQETDPAVAATIHTSLANVFLGRGEPDRARHHARRALERFGGDTLNARAARARHALGQALADGGQYEAALPHHRAAVATLRRLADEGNASGLVDLSIAINTYGATLASLNRTEEAEAAYREAIEIARRAGGDRLVPLNNLAVLQGEAGRNAEAAATLGEIVEATRSQGTSGRYALAISLGNQAVAMSKLGPEGAERALSLFREAHDISVDAMGANHPATLNTAIATASHLGTLGRFAEARREADAVLDRARTLLGEGDFTTAYAQNVAGTVACDGGDPQRGARLLDASQTARRALLPEGHWLLDNGDSLLGGCLARTGDTDRAERLLTSSYRRLRTALGPEDNRTRKARERLADLYRQTGQTAKAARLTTEG